MDTKTKIIELLTQTKRKGIKELISHLEDGGFFKSPASTRYHGCYAGGLAEHSYKVYDLLTQHDTMKLDAVSSAGQNPLQITDTTLVIAALLHDVCKMGAYIGAEKPYKWNKAQPKGHAALSLIRLKGFIKLTELEEMMIKYHMGVYGLDEFYDEDDWQTGEYPLRGDHSKDDTMSKEESKKARYGQSMANAWFHNPIVKVMYFCDELAALQEKAEKE